MSQRLAECCCKENPCNGPSGSCCFPDGSCRDVACEFYCSKQGGVFRPNVQCSGNPCVPPTRKCRCDDATWRYYNLEVYVVRLYIRTIVEETDGSGWSGLEYYYRYTTFFGSTYLTTQARIDLGIYPPPPGGRDNSTGWPLGTTVNPFPYGGGSTTGTVTVQEWTLTQECCSPVSATYTAKGPTDYYWDGQGGVWGPFDNEWSWSVSLGPEYNQYSDPFCYDCCCQRIPEACLVTDSC